MTKRLRVLLLLLAGFIAAGCTERRKAEPQLDPRHTITVDGTTIRYNGRELRWDRACRQEAAPRSLRHGWTFPGNIVNQMPMDPRTVDLVALAS